MISTITTENPMQARAGSSPSDPISEKLGQIYIRPYQDSDSEQVRELLKGSFGTGTGSILRSAMKGQLADKVSMALYSIGTLSLCFQAISFSRGSPSMSGTSPVIAYFGQVILFATVATFLNRVYGLYTAMMKFISLALNGDMLDIGKHYGMSDRLEGSVPGKTKLGQKNGYWVAELQERDGSTRVVGGTGIDVTTCNDPSSAELRRMVVSPICRRRGVGAQLIKVALDHAKKHGIKLVCLTTSVHQTSALNLYEKFGWVRQRNFWYLGGLHVTDLSLDLDNYN